MKTAAMKTNQSATKTNESSASRETKIPGIHHVTAIASEPQANLDFYAGVLGLRLVKKTVNFDDPGTYHLYFGDELGHPGTIMTFFPWPGAKRGQRGVGQATETAFAIPEGSIGFWKDRLTALGVENDGPSERFGEEVLSLRDPDGLGLGLVARPEADEIEPWQAGPVKAQHTIRGFDGVTLDTGRGEVTAAVLAEAMGLEAVGEEENRFRFTASGAALGGRVDVLDRPGGQPGRVAAGSVHHVAFRTADDDTQASWLTRLREAGLMVTDVQDRQYFRSIYFREPGGVLFEIATDPPGFTRDEAPEALGSGLKLPPWLEPSRERIERSLPRLEALATTLPGAAS